MAIGSASVSNRARRFAFDLTNCRPSSLHRIGSENTNQLLNLRLSKRRQSNKETAKRSIIPYCTANRKAKRRQQNPRPSSLCSHHSRKLLVVHLAVAIHVRIPDHVIQHIVRQLFADDPHDVSQLPSTRHTRALASRTGRCTSAAEMNPLPSLSKALNASRSSSS